MKVGAFFIAVLLFSACPVQAQIVNGSFEEDPYSPLYWDSTGQTPEILQTYTAYYDSNNTVVAAMIEAVEGSNFVFLSSGDDETNYSQLTQTIDVNAGESITGLFFFDANDYLPFNDKATIKLVPADPRSGLTEILLAQKEISDLGDWGSMEDWERFHHTFGSNETGTYILTVRIDDVNDSRLPSYLAVDALEILSGPPYPWCDYNLVGDIDHDCKVDFIDLALMATNWLVDCNVDPETQEACVPK